MTSNRFSSNNLLVLPVLTLVMLFSSCNHRKQIRGSEFVPRDIMVEMMVDMHLIDGLTNDVSYYRKFNPNDSVDLYGHVYEEYGMTKEKFHTTMLEYASTPNLLDKLYGEVLNELNLMQEELDKERDVELDRKNKALGKDEELKPKKRELKSGK